MTNLLSILNRTGDSTGSFPSPRDGEFPSIRQGELVTVRMSPSCEDSDVIRDRIVSPFDMTFLTDSPVSKSSSVGTRNTFLMSRLDDEEDSDEDSDNVMLLRLEVKGEKEASCIPRSFVHKMHKAWSKVKKAVVRRSGNGRQPKSSRLAFWGRTEKQSIERVSVMETGYDYMCQSEDENEFFDYRDASDGMEMEAVWSS